MKTQPGKVSLSGKTRLTYHEAVALLGVANEGLTDFEARGSDFYFDQKRYAAADAAINKLKDALGNAGGYDEDGFLRDPFDD